MTTRPRRWLLLCALGGGLGCSDESTVPAAAAGSGAAGGSAATSSTTSATTTTTSTSATTSSGSGGATASPCPDFPGWLVWKAWDAPPPIFCVPDGPENLPDPIVWEPCDPLADMASGCEQMKVTWTTAEENTPVTPAASMMVEEDGTTLIQFFRNATQALPPHRTAIVAEVDGAVRSAFRQRWNVNNDWSLAQSSDSTGLRGGHAILRILGPDPAPFLEATIGHPTNQIAPELLHVWPESGGHGIATSGELWATYDAATIGAARYDGTMPWQVISQSSLQQSFPVLWDDTIFWSDSDAAYTGRVLSWRAQTGVVPFIDFSPDPTQAVYGFGTDGTHHAWVHFKGKSPSCSYHWDNCPYAEADIMAAPFTKDPATLAPKRLRSWPSNRLLGRPPLAVGCGYVAYGYSPGKTLIVRISDGGWWELPSTNCSPPNIIGDWCFESVIGITCDHAYVRGGIGAQSIVTRVALASLDPASPPD